MKFEATTAGWHLTLPLWRFVADVVRKIAFRENAMPPDSVSVPHVHRKYSWYATIGAGLKVGAEVVASGAPDAVTVHLIRPGLEHPWAAIADDPIVFDLHSHPEHVFKSARAAVDKRAAVR